MNMFLLFFSLLFTPLTHALNMELVGESQDHKEATIALILKDPEVLLKDTISFGLSDPAVTVADWKSDQQPQQVFDKKANRTTPAYQGKSTITLIFSKPLAGPTTLFMHFMTNRQRFPQERSCRLFVTKNDESLTAQQQNSTGDKQTAPQPTEAPATVSSEAPRVVLPHHDSATTYLYKKVQRGIAKLRAYATNISNKISALLTADQAWYTQLLLVLLLGILMSLTPCIYPMIPITVSLLGVSPGNSLFRNFLLALAYAMGLATTFACLGLSAVFFGMRCGSILCNPWIVGGMVAFLFYCGGSMFGWYELHIPRWLMPQQRETKRGSHLSAFLFGSISGLIASPCMSPGLALILSMVAGIGDIFRGFALLFVFGIGSAAPLLLVGTFSGSLQLLPRSGMWMQEVKKFFGLMLFLVAFYYLQFVMPLSLVLGSAALFLIIAGIAYSTNNLRARTMIGKIFITMISFLLITGGLYVAYRAFVTGKKIFETPAAQLPSSWLSSYQEARTLAQEQGKLLLVDFRADWCSVCVMIEKKVLHDAALELALKKIIAVRLDGTTADNKVYEQLTQQFKVYGIPALLLIDPTDEKVLQRWGGELLEKGAQQFSDELEMLISKHKK